LWLRGRCRTCRNPISIRYPLVELANGLLYLWLAVTYGPVPGVLVMMAFASAMLALALIDLDHHLLPDVITIPGIGFGLLRSFAPGSLDAPRPLAALGAAVGGYLAFFAL